MKRWLCFWLALLMTVTLLGGCKNAPQEEERAAADEWVDVIEDNAATGEKNPSDTPNYSNNHNKNNEPQTENNVNHGEENIGGNNDEPAAPAADGDEESKEPEDTENAKDFGNADEETPIAKETSGTAITFLMQNLRTGGNQPGVAPTEWGGGSLILYYRARRFKQLVMAQEPDVILAQEATPGWLNFFKTDPYFSKTYTLFYAYRKPGSAVEMATPVLYKTAKYTAMESGHFWLSETPKFSSPTHGYTVADGETHYRNSSWVKLKDKTTNAVFYAYSTHFDAGRPTVASKSMQQYVEIFEDLGKDAYAFVGGDFNFDYRSEEYNLAMDWESEVDLQDMAFNMEEDGLCEVGGRNGSLHTNYEDEDASYEPGVYPDPNPGRGKQLDYIFAKLHPNMAVDYWGFDYNDYEDPVSGTEKGFISDHYGLICKVRIGTEIDYSDYQTSY